MNWFDTSGLTSLAKNALKEAQKTIDKALDIQDDSEEEQEGASSSPPSAKSSPEAGSIPQKDSNDFFSSWGLTVSAEGDTDSPIKEQPVVTESPSKANSQSLWGSFAGSFFEQPKTDDNTIVRPPKAKSLNVICDKYDSQDDLFSKSQLVMSDGSESLDQKKNTKSEDRRKSSLSNALSFVSSRNSSDSVEVLSQSLKTTPDSEAASYQSASQSSSMGLKPNSESVEILPDSLISPSSIECLGFDSYASDINSSSSSNLTPTEGSDKKSTPIGEGTEKVRTADSVSLVADDDEDTMSYNSISECTAPTVLDTDEKPISPFPKIARLDQRKPESIMYVEQPASQRMHISENSSNDGSWSDRTLNADNDSITLENINEENKKECEDMSMEKLSDSSSFYNVNVTADMLRSESSFVNIERPVHSPPGSNDSSQKDCIVKERTSPVSSDSKSDLVKIGSDRTSGHTSGDEIETTTSSDIEIIPSPNGDSGNGCRNSPGKYGFKHKMDGTTSPNLVDLVLGKNLATKIRGHNRELSDASIKSNMSDESQGSENERLMRRLSEMAEILDARENRLMEVSRNNAELAECNAHLKCQMESLMAKHETSDINTITEDYTQRMSALEKKFQQAIREKDQLRKQLDNLKQEISRKSSTSTETLLKEKDDMIAQLQEEGEKLARQELQHSNIIKKLRAKEKDNEQVIKSLRDKIAEQSSELDRMKRSLAAKEELEVSQIEAVYRLTNANKKMETELNETKSALDDTTQKLESARTSLDAARKEITELQRNTAELNKYRTGNTQLEAARERAERQAEMLRHELRQLRAERAREEQRWVSREEALRREVSEASLARAASGAERDAPPAALLAQLAALQAAALHHERARTAAAQRLAEVETQAAKAVERERLAREESQALQERLSIADSLQRDAQAKLDSVTRHWQGAVQRLQLLEGQRDSKIKEFEELKNATEKQIEELQKRITELEHLLEEERTALDTERKRNTILQEQLSTRGDVSPSQSVLSDTLSNSLWNDDTSTVSNMGIGGGMWIPQSIGVGSGGIGGVGGAGVAGVSAALQAERDALRQHVASLTQQLEHSQSVQEQYDALLQMYGEKEEQLEELRLDLHDVTQLYKAQLDELVALRLRDAR
ncbi:TATA element modulatory factor [Colias croceus]|uniref:TATA element modulatory factor n=1 Tax=Colias crocea TaxID=72248 RepID=UPI001E280EBC|nr:TATA element modulatory factor [Colias croceus]